MSSVNQEGLICPNTGEECVYYHFCAGLKEVKEEGIHPDSEMGKLYAKMPEAVKEIVGGPEWCSDKRILALGTVANNPKSSAPERFLAVRIADDMALSRGHFIGTRS